MLGESTGDSLMLIFIVCSLFQSRPFILELNASCVSSFECSKIESADHTFFPHSFPVFFVCFCSSGVHQLFLYIAFLLENVVC